MILKHFSREFQRRAVGITVTNFKEHELTKLKNMGNEKAKSIWRATWNPKTDPKPSSGSATSIKDFIQKTYSEKRWYKPPSSSTTSAVSAVSKSNQKRKSIKEETEVMIFKNISYQHMCLVTTCSKYFKDFT